MNYFFAPMEGITGFPYRNVHHRMFGRIDAYYTPFLVANQTNRFKKKELRDVLPENNTGVPVVPQVLTNKADQFLNAVEKLAALGYDEINLNLGCPMPMEVTKKKGAGFLAVPDELDAFFEAVFDGMTRWRDSSGRSGNIRISVKTRIGLQEASESVRLMEIFNRYPIDRLIIHARRQVDFYKGVPDLDTFGSMLETSVHPIVYNGDLFTVTDVQNFRNRFPNVETLMLGRGLVRNPALARQLCGGEPLRKEELRQFVAKLFEQYRSVISGDLNVMFKMKEIWSYLGDLFPEAGKALKQIRKARTLQEYEMACEEVFRTEMVLWLV